VTLTTRRYRSWTSNLGRLGRRAATAVGLVAVLAGPGGAADYRVRWQPSPTTGVTAYNVYVRASDSAFGAARNAGLPAVAGDGSMSYTVTGLAAGVAYRFAVSARVGTAESAFSNELGVCGTGADCDDGNPCTDNVCSSGICAYPAGNEGGSCDDGNVCSGTETCQGGACVSSGPLSCNDNNPCTTDSCAPQGGCRYTLVSDCQACTSSGTCSDGNPCNGTETCVSGRCRTGTPISCNDGNACTLDSCNAQTGCAYSTIGGCRPCANNAACGDGDLCNGVETCVVGRCRTASPLDCDDVDPCTNDSCAAATGCVHELQDTCYSCDLRAQATLYATRVTIKRSGFGIHFRAVGLLEPATAADPAQTGIVFDIQQPSTGDIFYRAIVPGSALVRGAAGHTLRIPLGTEVPTAPGLKFMRIRSLSNGRLLVAVFGKAQKMPSAFPVDLGWTLMLGDQCGSDRCTAYARTSDCH
jgi:hypothetical protein